MSTASGVQLDDIGLSDDSDDDDEVDLSRTIRRLPAARNLRQAMPAFLMRQEASRDSMSSIGTTRIPSQFLRGRTASTASGSSADEAVAGVAVITNFVVEGLESDDEEAGDVEAALRRLEGQIDESRQKQKAKVVEAQMQKSSAVGMKAGVRSSYSESEDGDIDANDAASTRSNSTNPPSAQSSTSEIAQQEVTTPEPETAAPPAATLAVPEIVDGPLKAADSTSRLSSIRRSIARKPSIRQLLSRNSVKVPPVSAPKLSVPTSFAVPHRSFVLLCKTETIARQLCLIERDLLSNIGWHEYAPSQSA